jgi:hypothetical protein
MKSKLSFAALALGAAMLVMPVNSAQAGFSKEMNCLFGWMHADSGKKVHKKHGKKQVKKSKKVAKAKKAAKKA